MRALTSKGSAGLAHTGHSGFMKPATLFVTTAWFGLAFALFLVIAACTQWDTYEVITGSVFPGETVSLGPGAFLHVGIAGGLYAGWALTLILLARNERLAREPALWTAIVWGLVLWYATDSVASVLSGGVYNLGGNTLFFALMLWPALRLRRDALAVVVDRARNTKQIDIEEPAIPKARHAS